MNTNFDSLINKVKEFSMTQFGKEYLVGSWGKGLLLWGLLAKYEYDADLEALEFVKKWVYQSVESQTSDGELSGGDPSQTNFATIGLSVLYFARKDRKSKELSEAIHKQAEYLLDPSLKRSDRDGLYYMKLLPQIWVDTVIMICPFLAQAGVFLKNSKYLEEAINQLNIHIDYLKDPGTGLYRHIWDDKKKKFYEGSLWGRGNGWMIASLVEVLEQLPKNHPQRNGLITKLQRLAELLVLCQDEQGFWRLFLDDVSEESKVETAGTLAITYGLSKAIRNEWVDLSYADYVRNAFEAVVSCVNENGKVTKASGPTIDPKRTSYNKPYPHAQGLFLITTNEITKLLEYLKKRELV